MPCVFSIDKRLLAGGAAMIAAGIGLSLYLASSMPVGTPGMGEDAAAELILDQRENRDMSTLAALLAGVGFLLVLVSFGARRRRRGSGGGTGAGAAARDARKPAA